MWSFLVASVVLVVIPGPDQALITRNALSGGRRAGLATVFGGASGVGVHATAAAFGLSALIAASADAFTALKLCGVAYLLFLAVRTWRTAGHDEVAESDAVEHRSVRGFYRQGLLFDVLNPKVALFFLTFLPQFLPRNAGPAHALALAAIFGVTYLAWVHVLRRVPRSLCQLAAPAPRTADDRARDGGGARVVCGSSCARTALGPPTALARGTPMS